MSSCIDATVIFEPTIKSDAPPVRLCPWVENPYRLVSLWDLMRLAELHKLVEEMRNLWVSATLYKTLGDKGVGQISIMDEALKKLDSMCIELDLPVSQLHIVDARQHLKSFHLLNIDPQRFNLPEMAAGTVSNNIEKEMSLKRFFFLPHDKVGGIRRGEFWHCCFRCVSINSDDASEACKCYGLSRNTACVFHLMRVLEIGLGALAKHFNKPFDHANWETIINQIEKAISEIDKDPNRPPNWKDEREFWSQCSSHFRVIKDAWRNYTIHVRGKFDEQEALDMLGNVRGFMQKLSTRLHE
jgi:hypothetical protein